MPTLDEKIAALARDLPDPDGARLFYERVTAEQPAAARLLARDEGLLSDALALAAWSPLLATTLAQHPEYFSWLARERKSARVRSVEELGESLARFALTNSQLDSQVLLARFRRRELLRIYLHDLRRASTIVETTEELSNLADAVLAYALDLARQELDNLYGAPQCTDARGRTAQASFSVVALGKLGSRELNYASDIDLLFLYSDDGATSETGARGSLTNREYFAKLSERIARLVGQPTGEGAAYRVDLRLRPHGRDGALACSVAEAVRYYHERAQAWELQALIRSRAAAGSSALYARFAEEVRARVYRREETVARALAHVRLAKLKIDRQHNREGVGFNVKLGRGGVREIEFVAQALQLAHGGRDEWLQHAPHTLISLGRLRDRSFVTEREHAALSDAYDFLRALEHRLQMEHGLQTHTVPDDPARRRIVARRMNFEGDAGAAVAGALEDFNRALGAHTSQVRAVYDRVFGGGADDEEQAVEASAAISTKSSREPVAAEDISPRVETDTLARAGSGQSFSAHEPPADAETASASHAATLLAPRFAGFASRAREDESERGEGDGDGEGEGESAGQKENSRKEASRKEAFGTDAESLSALSRFLRERAGESLNARRALSLVERVAASLDKFDAPLPDESGADLILTAENLGALVRVCGSSEYFGELLAGNPALIRALWVGAEEVAGGRDYRALLRAAVDREKNLGGEFAALRRAWARLLVEIGACDARGEITRRESNALQTALASASMNAALLVARRELARRSGGLAAGPRLAVLGLGRLGTAGMDYGSDLDIVLVYDERVPAPLAGLTREESYARLVEVFVASLSSLTRDGYLYRVDMRLRPDGKNGAAATGGRAFVRYLSERAGVWEWLAYVKLHAVAGDLELGRMIEGEARAAIHEAALAAGTEVLRTETRRVRERLEQERTKSRQHARGAIDIKFGAGGMLDVYFAARYLQLRDRVPDEGEDRSTRATLKRLRDAGSLGGEDFRALDEGYVLLRTLDHHLRLLLGRSTRLPAPDHPALRDLAQLAGHDSAAALSAQLAAHMRDVRAAYERITEES